MTSTAPQRTPTTVLFSPAQFSAFFSMVAPPSAAAGCAGVHNMRARALPPAARRHGCMPSVGLGALRAIVGGSVHDPWNWRRLFHGCTVGRLQEKTPPRSTWAPLWRGPRPSTRPAIITGENEGAPGSYSS